MTINDIDIPPLIHGRSKFYCAKMCGVKWDGKGRKRAKKLQDRYLAHYRRRHIYGTD